MKWPVGKYNGRRIVGARIDVLLDITIPPWDVCLPDRYGRCLGLGPLRIWFHAEYESIGRENKRRAAAKETACR